MPAGAATYTLVQGALGVGNDDQDIIALNGFQMPLQPTVGLLNSTQTAVRQRQAEVRLTGLGHAPVIRLGEEP
jgi:hypothetical protein